MEGFFCGADFVALRLSMQMEKVMTRHHFIADQIDLLTACLPAIRLPCTLCACHTRRLSDASYPSSLVWRLVYSVQPHDQSKVDQGF